MLASWSLLSRTLAQKFQFLFTDSAEVHEPILCIERCVKGQGLAARIWRRGYQAALELAREGSKHTRVSNALVIRFPSLPYGCNKF